MDNPSKSCNFAPQTRETGQKGDAVPLALTRLNYTPMVKTLHIPAINEWDQLPIEQVNAQMDALGARGAIDCLNWKEQYPYMPLTTVFLAHSRHTLFVKWHGLGIMLKAVYTHDLDKVSKDSCVEFFCQLPDKDRYMNFEFNVIGTCNASTRKSRKEEVVYRTEEELQQIQRYASLGKRPFCEISGQFRWELCIGIPFSLLGIDPEQMPEYILGNFYKCADDTSAKHFVSWSPILTPTPDFHCPEYFGKLYLDK